MQSGAQGDAGGCSRTRRSTAQGSCLPAARPGVNNLTRTRASPSSPGTRLPLIFRALSPDGREKGGSGAQ